MEISAEVSFKKSLLWERFSTINFRFKDYKQADLSYFREDMTLNLTFSIMSIQASMELRCLLVYKKNRLSSDPQMEYLSCYNAQD